MFVEIQEMAAQGFGGGMHMNSSPYPDALRSEEIFQKPSLHEGDAYVALDIDASNKIFFEELGLLQGDQVVLLSSVHGRVIAHNAAAFVRAVVQITNKVSHSANPS
jgi:hypothetical protein